MTEQTLSDPLARLLALGDTNLSREWTDYAAMGIGPEHIPDLVRLVADGALLLDASRGNESWAPVHAWRALGQLRAKEAIEPLLSLFHLIDEEDLDDVAEDGPVALGMIGPAAGSLWPAIWRTHPTGCGRAQHRVRPCARSGRGIQRHARRASTRSLASSQGTPSRSAS